MTVMMEVLVRALGVTFSCDFHFGLLLAARSDTTAAFSPEGGPDCDSERRTEIEIEKANKPKSDNITIVITVILTPTHSDPPPTPPLRPHAHPRPSAERACVCRRGDISRDFGHEVQILAVHFPRLQRTQGVIRLDLCNCTYMYCRVSTSIVLFCHQCQYCDILHQCQYCDILSPHLCF